MFDVICFGSATVDVFVKTRDIEDIEYLKGSVYYKKIISYPIGSKILVKKINYTIGGGGTNTAVAFSRLGLKTAFLGKLGKDINGNSILNVLKKEKVNTSLTLQKKGKSGFSVVLDAFGKDRTILTYRGLNDEISINEIALGKLKTRWLYFSSLMKNSLKTQEKIAVFAKKNQIKILYNPSSYLVKEGIQLLKKLLKNTEILILNKKEAQSLTKKKEIKDIIRRIYKEGPRIIVITDGKFTTNAFYKNEIYSFLPPKIKPLETTGAGDAFTSGLLAGYIRKKDIVFALKLGLVNSRSVIRHRGAKNKLLTFNEALKQIKSLKVRIKKEKFRIRGV